VFITIEKQCTWPLKQRNIFQNRIIVLYFKTIRNDIEFGKLSFYTKDTYYCHLSGIIILVLG